MRDPETPHRFNYRVKPEVSPQPAVTDSWWTRPSVQTNRQAFDQAVAARAPYLSDIWLGDKFPKNPPKKR